MRRSHTMMMAGLVIAGAVGALHAAVPASAAEQGVVTANGRTEGSDTPAAASDDQGGHEVIDNAASERREREFERTPALPQVFLHQWRYREPPVPIPDSRSAERGEARLTLAEAVHAALQHNPGVAARRLTPLSEREKVRRAEAVFDPVLSLNAEKQHREAPNSNALTGVRENITTDVNANLRLQKQLRTGAQFTIDFTNNRFVSNAEFQSLVPQYRPELLFSLNQPLLRNFGANFAYLLVDITNLTSEAAAYAYRAELADFVKRVIEAYWAVVFARQNLQVQEQSLELARQTLRENRERVRIGLLAPVAVKEAESQAALREEQVIVASNALDNARRALRQVVYLRRGDTFVPESVEPVEDPRTAPVTVEAESALAVALERRPEIVAQNLELRSRNLTVRVRENQLLPRVDFVGNIGLNGLAGDPEPVEFQGQTIITPFGGSYGRALDRMVDTDYYQYKAGVEIEIPIGNAAAKSEYAQAKIDVSQSELNRRQLLSDITLEVGKAVNDVVANMKRIQSARVARELAEENLRNQQKRLEVGIATTKDVLDFQNDLTTARGVEVQAATDYNVSLAELARAQGTLLDAYSVVIEVPGKRFVPWWARF